ncbi:MAG: DNA adenine methyltransferase YhdJ (plasmid) [Candidatus Erwinia impunctatus]
MSRFIHGNCIDVMRGFPDCVIDLIVTDPPYLVGFKDRQGRSIAGDVTDEWLQPACHEMYRVLKKDALMVSFYGWNRVDRFMAAWKSAGFYAIGQLVFTKPYASNGRSASKKKSFVNYCHEGAYLLAKGNPVPPERPLSDVLPFPYTGNKLHPTQKPVEALQPLIESFSAPGAIVLDPFAGSGSTCVAALQSGRRYIGIEMMEKYHLAGQYRLAAVQRSMLRPAANGDWLPEAA